MTNPLVEKLRAVIPYQGKSDTAFLCHQAADRIEELEAALRHADQMISVAHPQFNWGASCLSADAIRLLNVTPAAIRQALFAESGR